MDSGMVECQSKREREREGGTERGKAGGQFGFNHTSFS